MWRWLQGLFARLRRLFGGRRGAVAAVKVSVVRGDEEYFLLLGELLDRLVGDPSHTTLRAWSIWRGVKEGEMAVWLRGVELDETWRGRLVVLVGLGKGELTVVAEEVLGLNKVVVARESKFDSDDAQVWLDRGLSLIEDEKYLEAIEAFDEAIAIKKDFYEAWERRGIALGLSEVSNKRDKVVASYKQAISINPDHHEAWYELGLALSGKFGSIHNKYGCLTKIEAIEAFDRVIKICPDHYQAWMERGYCLMFSGRGDRDKFEALKSFDQAIKIKPNSVEAWEKRAWCLKRMNRFEEAIDSYNRTIQLDPNHHSAWDNRGDLLSKLERYEEAIFSYEQVIRILQESKDSFHKVFQAWYKKGIILSKQEKYSDAITSFDGAIQIDIKHVRLAWFEKGLCLARLEKYDEVVKAFSHTANINMEEYISSISSIEELNDNFIEFTPEKNQVQWGRIYLFIGQYLCRKKTKVMVSFYDDQYLPSALRALGEAEKLLQHHPEYYLGVIKELVVTFAKLEDPIKSNEYLDKGRKLLIQLVNDQSDPKGKRNILMKFNSIKQIEVDVLLRDQRVPAAIEAAEFSKNLCLESLMVALQEKVVSPSYEEIQTLLQTGVAIIYWHLSPTVLTTFMIQQGSAKIPFIRQYDLIKLQDWIIQWDRVNTVEAVPTASNNKKKADNLPLAPGFAKLDWHELYKILKIDEIKKHLSSSKRIILIPHKDLHRLPLHQFFDIPATYLPSLQIALNLSRKTSIAQVLSLDLIQPPVGSNLPNAEVEVAIIKGIQQPDRFLSSDRGTKFNFLKLFETVDFQSRRILHFTGHGQHFARRPQESCLYVNDNQTITCQDLATSNLQPYHLIVLSACQTSIVHHQTLHDEYVGLVSACLSGGASYTISALWSVEDRASSPFFIYFYQQLAQNISVPQALHHTSQWLRHLTNQELYEFYEQLLQNHDLDPTIIHKITNTIKGLRQVDSQTHPFQDPYYWAAFTVSGAAPGLK